MGRKSQIWKRGSDDNYYTTYKGVRHKLGPDLEVAKVRFQQITGDDKYQEMEPLVVSLCEAANHIARHLTKEEATALLDAMYGMRKL